MSDWYKTAYRRNVVDMHITADDPSFMTEFDAEAYVAELKQSRTQSAVVYAHSHVGLMFYPTQVGCMHTGLKGRDILAEVIAACHREGIQVVVYMSLIYDTWAARNHPDWCIQGASRGSVSGVSRYGVCCPNSPYRDYAASIAREICQNYDFEGIRCDMTFWPAVCTCPHCQARFAAEVGGELPTVIDWSDPRWVAFQRKREEWLADLAALVTSTIRTHKPGATVEHQASTYPLSWRFGATEQLAVQNDFLQGDFYGDDLQGSIARKLFHNLSPRRPAAFETSIATDLRNYTALKSEELLQCKASAALSDGCAFVFIDTIDPKGTLNPAVYARMQRVFARTEPYEPFLGGELCQDVGVYLSQESKYDPADNGRGVNDYPLSPRLPHVDAVVSACQTLRQNHVPFGVISKKNLADLKQFKVVVLPNVLVMDDEEIAMLRDYVYAGGCLYASRYTSLRDKAGRLRDDFGLADVFGVSYRGETRESFTFIYPANDRVALLPGYTRAHPVGLATPQVMVEPTGNVTALGLLALPYTDPADGVRFASIHNNPVGIYTGKPAIVLNRYGRGWAVYAAGDIESSDPQRASFLNLLRLFGQAFTFEADAPKPVEITCFHQPEHKRYVVSLVNFQKDLPNIPVEGITVRLRAQGRPVRLVLLPEQVELPFVLEGDGAASFSVPRLETLQMLALSYAS